MSGRRQNGFVLDLSRTGLFIQTSADPNPGERLDIEVVIGDQVLPMHVEVARRKKVPPQLLTVAQGGIGVRILSAPEAYYTALAELKGPNRDVRGGATPRPAARRPGPAKPSASGPVARAPAAPASPDPELPGFRVRVAQVNGTRTRTVRVSARDEAQARLQVKDDLGEEWKILEVSALPRSG
jgi:hypothetical protein